MTDHMRQVVLDRYPDGIPVVEDFRIEEAPIPTPEDGEVLCETLYLSLDPYMRNHINICRSANHNRAFAAKFKRNGH